MNEVEIVIIEDNPEDIELMMRALNKGKLANNVRTISDGQEALDYVMAAEQNGLAGGRPPKVILLDLKLPKVSGLDVLRQLKQHEHTKNIPVVVLTSSKEVPDLEECYTLGVNSYIVKPVEFEAFLKVVTELGFYWLLLNNTPH